VHDPELLWQRNFIIGAPVNAHDAAVNEVRGPGQVLR
jgi:hypothetical protein